MYSHNVGHQGNFLTNTHKLHMFSKCQFCFIFLKLYFSAEYIIHMLQYVKYFISIRLHNVIFYFHQNCIPHSAECGVQTFFGQWFPTWDLVRNDRIGKMVKLLLHKKKAFQTFQNLRTYETRGSQQKDNISSKSFLSLKKTD